MQTLLKAASAALLCTLVAAPGLSAARPAPVPLAAPPAARSAAAAADEKAYQQGKKLRREAVGREAIRYARFRRLSDYEKAFSQPAGRAIGEEATPALHRMLVIAFSQADPAVSEAKKRFGRPRPYARHAGDLTCSPSTLMRLNPWGSYPSGHAARAQITALVLAEFFPRKKKALQALADRIGASRWICGQHWKSDIAAGQAVAKGIFRRLWARDDFVALARQARRRTEQRRRD